MEDVRTGEAGYDRYRLAGGYVQGSGLLVRRVDDFEVLKVD